MRKINKATGVVIFTVLAIGTIGIADYSKSGAKYYKDVEKGLTYNMGLSKLTTDGLGNLSSRKDLSEVDKLYLEYSVPRNMIMTEEDTTDKYRIVVDKGCEIKKVNGSNITSSSNTYTFTYSDKLAKNISVAYVCPVSSIEVSSTSDFMNPNLSIYEQMSTDVKEFIYTKKDALFKKSESLPQPVIGDYHQLIILATDDETIINRKITEWITNNKKEYINKFPSNTLINGFATETVIRNYLQKAYQDDIKQFDSSLIGGITFNDDNKGTYTYTMNEDFLGYAVTDNRFDINNNRVFYISNYSQTEENLKNILKDYVAKYLSSEVAAEDFINYVDSKGGITSVINGTNYIPGITYLGNGRVEIVKNIYNIIHPAPVPVEINVSDFSQPSDIQAALANGLISNYGDVLADELYSVFLNEDYDIAAIVNFRKNSSFNDCFIYDFGGKKVLVNISSDGSGKIIATASEFNSTIDLSLATNVSLATNYIAGDSSNIALRINEMAAIINPSYANLVTSDMIDNYVTGNGLFINPDGIIKAYVKNTSNEFGFGILPSTNGISIDDATNGSPDISITDDPEDVVAGDTPNEDIPIFDDLVTTEPSDTIIDFVPGENETETETPEKQESEEQEEDKTEEVDDNSKKADTDIEKEFVRDIEEVEKLIEDMKDFVGDAEQVSAEEEAIAEVDELIETVKDYVNEA